MYQKLKTHIDGEWWTDVYQYKEYELYIKMRKNHGSKIHIWDKQHNKIIKTFRYVYITPEKLIQKAKIYIDNL